MEASQKQLKVKIFLIRLIDWSIIIAITAFGISYTLSSKNPQIAALIAIIGLAIVNRFGQWSVTEIARLQTILRRLQKGASV